MKKSVGPGRRCLGADLNPKWPPFLYLSLKKSFFSGVCLKEYSYFTLETGRSGLFLMPHPVKMALCRRSRSKAGEIASGTIQEDSNGDLGARSPMKEIGPAETEILRALPGRAALDS